MSYEDKLALARTLKKKSIRIAPSDSILLEVKKGLEEVASSDRATTGQLIQSLNSLSEMLEAEKQDRTNKDDESSKKLIEALKAVQEEIKSIVIPEPLDKVRVEGLEELIKSLPKASPSVRVILKDDDVYSRYKRVNSSEKDGITHHGFANQSGNWFIQKEATTATGATSRYAVGTTDFSKAWSKRAALDYLPFYEVVIP